MSSSDSSQNISVVLRIRPRNAREIRENAGIVAQESSDHKQVNVKQANDFTKTFTFDKVFGPACSQEQVFAGMENMIAEVLLGYNCTIFAYGQV